MSRRKHSKTSHALAAFANRTDAQRDDEWGRSRFGGKDRPDWFPRPELDPNICAVMFRQDDFARRIVKTIVEDAMRQGFSFVDEGKNAEPEEAKQLNEACKRWGVGEKIVEADIWGRGMGGGYIMLGVKGESPNEPLLDDDIGEGDLITLDVYDRRDMVPVSYYRDQLSPKLGQVEFYRLQSMSASAIEALPVHETRLIQFGGVLTGRRERLANSGSDDSVLNCIFDVIESVNMSWKSIVALMDDFAQGVYKIKDLIKIIAQNEEGVLEQRMRIVDRHRSSSRAILLDADKEDFERKSTPVTGAADLIDKGWQRLSAAAEMSVTKLMGVSPAGMNATGESDRINDYDRIQGHREQVIAPRLERLGRIIARSEGIANPESLSLQFPSLWQITPIQAADIKLKLGQFVALMIDKSVILPSEVAISLFGKGKFSTEITINIPARDAMLKKEIAAALENAGKAQLPAPPKVPSLNEPAPGEPSAKSPTGA